MLARFLDQISIEPDMPERRAGMVAAVLAAVPCANPYHNLHHTREVLANTIWLLQANAALAAEHVPGAAPITPPTAARQLLAATMHELGHDGTTNAATAATGRRYMPFRLEDRTFDLMRSVLCRAGIDADAIADLHVMIRATDPRSRPDVRAMTDHILFGMPMPIGVCHEFAERLCNPRLALATALLCDADVMSSAGLTRDYHARMSALLAAEHGKPADHAETRDFFDLVVGNGFASAAGRRLNGNLCCIRAAALGTQNQHLASLVLR
jgi:hypothetical protein